MTFDEIRKNINYGAYDPPAPENSMFRSQEEKIQYRLDQSKLKAQFMGDLSMASGYGTDADGLVQVAWEQNHSEGYTAVVDYFEELLKVIEPIVSSALLMERA